MDFLEDKIEVLMNRGFSWKVVQVFERLWKKNDRAGRRMYVDLMGLTDMQVFRFNYYIVELQNLDKEQDETPGAVPPSRGGDS